MTTPTLTTDTPVLFHVATPGFTGWATGVVVVPEYASVDEELITVGYWVRHSDPVYTGVVLVGPDGVKAA